MILRRFNEAGLAEFRRFLQQCRETPDMSVPVDMLGNTNLTSLVDERIEVYDVAFGSRRDAAEYLKSALSPLQESDLRLDAGLWTWLTLFYFDQICSLRDGQRVVRNDYHYVFEPRNQRHFYRHLLFLAWRILTIAPSHNRLFLDAKLAVLDKKTSEIMKRLYLTRIPCIFEALDRIYWDPARKGMRPGLVSPGRRVPGDLFFRFPLRIRQLEMTYDLQSLNADQLIELLGDEFKFGHPVQAS